MDYSVEYMHSKLSSRKLTETAVVKQIETDCANFICTLKHFTTADRLSLLNLAEGTSYSEETVVTSDQPTNF